MLAVVQDRYGSADVLELAEIEQPSIGDDEVLVRVHAAGVAASVWHLMAGQPYMVRAMFGLRGPKAKIPGTEFAGTVEAVGPNVADVQIGAEVFGRCEGAFAELAKTKPDQIAAKPPGISFEQAAVVAESAGTALRGVRDVGEVEAGQRVLVIGAGGGVGSFAVQIAKALGAEVSGVGSTSKAELLRSLGADHVIDYTRESFEDGPQRYDVIIDTAGLRSVSRLRRVLEPRGTLVIIGGEGSGKWFGLGRQLRAMALSPFVRQKLRAPIYSHKHADLEDLKAMLEAGTVTPVIDSVYPLREAADAIRRWEQGHTRGKIVLTVPGEDARSREGD